jgi:phosphate transport system substrate-binding protein
MVKARQGKCANLKNCPVARANEIHTVPEGVDFHCPVCGLELADVTPKVSQKPVRPILVAAAVLLLLVGGIALSKNWVRLPSRVVAADRMAGKNTILRLAGSNTIGESLMPSIAEAFLRSRGATDVHTIAGEKAQEKIVIGTLPGDASPSAIRIAAHGSATAFTALADNSCDIGMASRRIKPDEASKLSSLGDMFGPASEHIVGLDGIAVIVNPSNPLNALTKDEVMRMFTGETTSWPKGSLPGQITVYARDDKSGTFDTFKSLVLAGKPLAPSAQRFESSEDLSDAVAHDPNGIGFIGLPFVRSAKPIAVSEKGTRGLLPTSLTVATEDYSLSRRLYLYTPATPANQFTRLFVEFALSKQGQDVVANNGFVAQNIRTVAQAVSDEAPDEYKKLTQNAQRLSLDFRFQTGVAVQDNKAQVDMDRVVSLISNSGAAASSKILLLGFADSVGSPAANKALSLNRARVIADQLNQRGLKASSVRGFGSELPVASNETADGREKNRRVEIWIEN